MTHPADRPSPPAARLSRAPALLLLFLLLGLGAPTRADAQSTGFDRWMVRTHTTGVLFDAESNPEALALDVEETITAGADVTYFPHRNVGVNLLAAFISPEVTSGGESLGSVDALPPVLTVQYHFLTEGPVRPYVGGGGSYVNFFGNTGVLDGDQADADIDDGWGVAGQGGLNVFLSESFSLMADFRWVSILNDPTVETELGNDELELNHAIISMGAGFSL